MMKRIFRGRLGRGRKGQKGSSGQIETAFVSQTQSSTEDLDEVDRLANHPVLRANTHDEWLLQHRLRKITEVPAHHDRVAITNIFDSSIGLAMKIIPSLKRCDISRPFMSISAREQEDTLVAAAYEDSEEESLEVSSRTAKRFNLAQIEGPELDFECIPEKFKKFVPKGYTVILVHEVQMTRDNFHQNSNHDEVFFTDPLTQKKYNYGDKVELWSDVFDFAPECKSKRVKRSSGWTESRNSSGRFCQNQFGHRVRCYGLKPVTCPDGCDVADSGFDCRPVDRSKNCMFVLICPVVTGDNCMAHLLSDQFTCRRCCRIRDCGSYLQQCKYTSTTDTCPGPGEGCPWEKVEDDYDRSQPSDQICEVDETCDTIVSGDGTAIGSGVACRKSRRAKYKKKFCCRDPLPTEESDLPHCED